MKFTEGCLRQILLDSCISKNNRIAMENNFDCIDSGEWHHNKIEKSRSCYQIFQMSIEKRIISGNPNISQVSLSNLSGEEWQNLSDEEKKKFKDMEVVDKERVKKEESIRIFF